VLGRAESNEIGAAACPNMPPLHLIRDSDDASTFTAKLFYACRTEMPLNVGGAGSRGRRIRRYVVLIPPAGDHAASSSALDERSSPAPASGPARRPGPPDQRVDDPAASPSSGDDSRLALFELQRLPADRTKNTTWPLSSVRHHGRTGSFRSVSTRSPSAFPPLGDPDVGGVLQ